ncbi:MAG: FtsX-like permease family protein [Ruminococcaceae bacterium]|nr:FtsX-like permease family protein [Oscillospiraceae bacterium]
MRAFLTMLGIIIGVAAVIILVSLMQGLTGEVTSMFSDLGTEVLTVSVQSRGATRTLDDDDFYEFYEENSSLFSYMSPNVTVSGTVKYNNTEYSSSVKGVSEQYMAMEDYTLTDGRFISYADIEGYQKICVIGSYLNRDVYGGSGVGNTIKIAGNKLTIVGVLDEIDDSTEGSGDDIILLPYSTACKIGNTQISSYSFYVSDTNNISYAENVIDNYLYGIFNSEDYYNITNMQSLIDQMEEMIGMMTMVLVGIAGISLLVGGIGIMNIMLVSVTERTREIGIRKSLGARRRDIMSQFVIEAGTTSAVGGAIGIFLGIVIAITLGNVIGINATPTFLAVGVSAGVSIFIGVLFGYLPASKASKLNPIDALRHE